MPDDTQPNPPLVLCTWSHVCGDEKKAGDGSAKPEDELMINVGNGGKIVVTPGEDHTSVEVTGEIELYREGDVTLTGTPGITLDNVV